MVNVLVCHGLGGSARENWFPWLKKELQHLNHNVSVPDFPNSENPKLQEWIDTYSKLDNLFDENSIFIGHSLGCPFLINVLQQRSKPVKATVLVAGFTGLLSDREVNTKVADFSDKTFNWDLIQQRSRSFYVIHSNNDPHVPLEKAEELAKNLRTEVRLIPNSGHFNDNSFPKLLDMIKKEL